MSRENQHRIQALVAARGIALDPPGKCALYAASAKLTEEWAELGHALYAQPAPDLAGIRAEIADMHVVLCRLACIVEAMSGVPFDLEAAALAKAEADVARGPGPHDRAAVPAPASVAAGVRESAKV